MQADLQSEIELEQLYNKNQLLKRLTKELSFSEVKEHCELHEIPEKFGISLLVQMVLHKRTSVDVLVGILHYHFEDEENPYQACADMLTKAIEANMVIFNEMSNTFILKLDVAPEVHEELERYQFPLPVLIEPKEVTKNTQSGYYSFDTSIILRDNHTEDDVCLDHINRVNKIPFSIDEDVVRLVKNKWKNLDKQKPHEPFSEFHKRQLAFYKYDRVSRDVIDHILMMGNNFWLTHRYDKRGRCYCQGYHINYQGNPWNKAVIVFAQKEVTQS